MRRLVHFHPVDEDQLPVVPPPPLNLDEDSDSWWAGVRQCFVAVPLASALAATALSASLAFGYTQQAEDIVPQPPPTVVEDYYSPPPPLPDRWVAWLPPTDEEVVPQPPPFAPDEDYWSAPTLPVDKWRGYAFAADEEIVPQPPTFAPDEDYWLPPFTQPRAWLTQTVWADPVVNPPPPEEEMILFRVGPIWIRID